MTATMDREEAERVVAGLTKAQRRAIADATYREEAGVWHPAGWYVAADQRVRYALARLDLTRDYLRKSNRLTPRGLQILALLQREHI